MIGKPPNRLMTLKLATGAMDDPEMKFGMIKKTARLGIFDFWAFPKNNALL